MMQSKIKFFFPSGKQVFLFQICLFSQLLEIEEIISNLVLKYCSMRTLYVKAPLVHVLILCDIRFKAFDK